MGLLILSRGRSVKVALAGAIVFLIAITPLGIWTLPNLVLAAGLAWLLKEEYKTSVWHSPRYPRIAMSFKEQFHEAGEGGAHRCP